MFVNGWQSDFKYDNLGLEVERNMLAGVSSYKQRDKLGRIKSHRVSVGAAKPPLHACISNMCGMPMTSYARL